MTSQSRGSRQGANQESPTGDPPIIIYDENNVYEGVEACTRSLVGKILTEKPIHMNNLQSALAGIWCNPRGFKVEEVKAKTFQFFFEKRWTLRASLMGVHGYS
ncbi:hypothetical protein SESBI_19172, partial [Sesbania bispinosa]